MWRWESLFMPLAAAINETFPLNRTNITELLVGFHVTEIGRKDVQSLYRSSKNWTPHSRCHVFRFPWLHVFCCVCQLSNDIKLQVQLILWPGTTPCRHVVGGGVCGELHAPAFYRNWKSLNGEPVASGHFRWKRRFWHCQGSDFKRPAHTWAFPCFCCLYAWQVKN